MNDLKDETTFNLATRLNEIEQEKQKLDLEYNQIIMELCERVPSLKDDVNLQPKVIKKERKK